MANEFIARSGLKVLLNGIVATGSISASGDVSAVNFLGSGQYLTDIAADSVQWTNVLNKPAGIVSSSTQFTNASDPFTGSFSGSFYGDGSNLSGIATVLAISGSTGNDTVNLKVDALTFTGSNGVTTAVTDNKITIAIPNGVVSASSQVDHNSTTNYVANQHIDHSTVSISAGSGLAGGGNITATRTLSLDTGSVHFLDGVKKELNTEGVFSSSAQVVASAITGIGAYATTGSNTFTGIQDVSNTTQSTTWADGALKVAGGVGIGKNLNVSGAVNITGLLTVVSMSTQYVTSSQYTVGTSRIILNDDDNVRFAGISVIDSGSTYGTGSLLWDSFNNHWIYEADDQAYQSAVIIAGPRHTGTLGDEPVLIAGRVPVATGGDHIDNRLLSSSIRVDFPTLLTHIESGLYVTGSVTSSVGFNGNGAGLTNVTAASVAYTNITGKPALVSASSQVDHNSTTNYVANQHIDHSTVSITAGAGLSGGGNITATRTLSVDSGSMLPYYSSSIFSRISGDVTVNSSGVASVGAISSGISTLTIASALYTGSLTTSIVGPTTNQVVATIATGSYDAAHFNYVIKDATNIRTGTVMSVWKGASIEFTDTSTNDIGNTSEEIFAVDVLSGNVRLKLTTGTGTWTVKTAVNLI